MGSKFGSFFKFFIPSVLLVSSVRAVLGTDNKILDDETVLVSEAEAVAGGVAKMPCDVQPPMPDDKAVLIIWYKDGAKHPIYTIDARTKPSDMARHWSDNRTLGSRAVFRQHDDPAKLTVDRVQDKDAGIYRCRVDFKKSPTRNSKITLTIILPPEKLMILDASGNTAPQNKLGPYNEGSSVNITCIATGGRPPPRVTWWQENALLSDFFIPISDHRVQNTLHLERLERRHLNMMFTCQASNNNLVAPISSAVTLDLNLRPLWVRLLGENRPLSADNTYELQCEAVGARPTPTITWLKGRTPLRNTREMTSRDSNVTTSTLTFVPTMEDSGKILTCRTETPLIANSQKEDEWILNIHHVPIVNLELGSNLNATTIREGVDVYFDCSIKSNPWVYKVSWRHNGKPLNNNATAGTIVSNQSLVLQSVTRTRAGLYTCVGSNQEGDGESNPVNLDIKYAPVCRSNQQKVHGVARQEVARVVCDVDANPSNNIYFMWKFNNSAELVDIPSNHFTADHGRSIASYTPTTELDYGTLLCWGRNELGVQKDPCYFQIIPAGKPDPLYNCTIVNQTADSLNVECSEGFDGGLTQEFVMEVYDAATQALVSNVSSKIPSFTVNGLESGLGFDISLYAANMKGRSEMTPLHAYTLKAAEKRTGWPEKPQPPEKCNILRHTITTLIISCQVPHLYLPSTYVLRAFDAETRRIVATATSQEPLLEITNLPVDRSRSLILSVRTTMGSATSDAFTFHTEVPEPQEQQHGASPTILQLTPILGILIGLVTALVLVAIIIVVFMRLRGRGDGDEKEREERGNGSSGNHNIDKSSSIPLNKDMDDSIESMDEKNPDIIPQNSDDYQDPDEKAFEKLNNAPNRIYSTTLPRIPSSTSNGYENTNNVMNIPKSGDEVTYAELSLSNAQPTTGSAYAMQSPHVQTLPHVRRQEPVVYAQIDVTKKAPLPTSTHPDSCLSLPLLHPHHLSGYQHILPPPPVTVDAETPLIASHQHRESTV